VHFLSGSFCKIRGQANRADPAAEAFTQEETEHQGGQEDGETGRMDGVVFSGQSKPFQADQGAKGEKGLDRRWALDELLRGQCRPEIKSIKLQADSKAEYGKQ